MCIVCAIGMMDAYCRRLGGWAAGCIVEKWWFDSRKEQEISPFSEASTFTPGHTPSRI